MITLNREERIKTGTLDISRRKKEHSNKNMDKYSRFDFSWVFKIVFDAWCKKLITSSDVALSVCWENI